MVRYLYIRKADRKPVGCLAYEVFRDQLVVKYGFSAHNPEDRWNKKEARRLATSRLADNQMEMLASDESFDDIIYDLLWEMEQNKNVPNRLRRPINRMLSQYWEAEEYEEEVPKVHFNKAIGTMVMASITLVIFSLMYAVYTFISWHH